ncbi:MAG: ATP-binding cassette domain-containing protein, partial [Eubacteriales bacterium]
LDFEHLTALKDLMTQYQGTLLVVTHNRYLLNHCFQKVLHLENCKLLSFEGGYISYTYSLLETKIDCTELAEKDTEELARNEILIENLRDIAENSDSASNGRSLRARVSYQERLEARRTHNPFLNLQKPNFEFLSEGGVPDEIALTVRDFSLAFEETILDNVNFEIKFTDKVGVIGGNGTGKTSLLREIYKNSNQSITFHEGVTLSYLSQNHDEMFSSDQSIFDLFFDLGFPTYDTISDYLKGFCFPIEKMDQQISRLSGGEKNTLGLAVICHKKSNFLILDEPTSHLDTVGQIAFEAGLSRYQGGCLMISHDFYTLSNCMDYLLILEEKTVRKMQLRKFRKKTYANHFTHDYLALEQHKKQLETKIESALSYKNIELAREILLELEQVVKEMS